MATRQPIQARHSSMLYIGLLILALLPALAVMMLIVTPEREEHQQAQDDLAEMRGTARAYDNELIEMEATTTAMAQAYDNELMEMETEMEATATAMAQAYNTAMNYSHWPPFFYDDFKTNQNDWFTGEQKGELATVNRFISNNKYHWDVKAVAGMVSRSYSDMGSVSDFYLTVEGQQISGAEDAYYGAMFRQDENNNYYLFSIGNDQYFRFSLRYQEEWVRLIRWTKSSAIQPNKVNRLTVIAEGSHFLFYINDQLVAEAEDSRLSRGEVGLAIGLLNDGDEGVFEFDNFEVRAQ